MTDLWIDTFREEFEKLLSTKTGWGRKEIMLVFEKAQSNTVRSLMLEKATKGVEASEQS